MNFKWVDIKYSNMYAYVYKPFVAVIGELIEYPLRPQSRIASSCIRSIA